MKLKHKIPLQMITGLVLFLMLVAIAVSLLVFHQNRVASNSTISRAFNIVREALLNSEDELLDDTNRTATMGDMGTQIQFLSEEKDGGNIILTESSFRDVAATLYTTIQSRSVQEMAVYDMEGDIIAFAMEKDGEILLGYPLYGQDAQRFYVARLSPGDNLTNDAWEETDRVSAVSTRYSSDTIASDSTVAFRLQGGFLSLVAEAPCQAPAFNEVSGEIEQVQSGVVVAVLQFGEAFVKKMAALTDTEINVFNNQGELTAGTLQAYRKTDMNVADVVDGKWRLSEQKLLLDRVTVADHGGYFIGGLPIYDNAGPIATIHSLVSTATALANTFQTVKIMIGIFLIFILISPPMAYFAVDRSVIRPVSNVVEGLKNIAQGEGDLTRGLETKTTDEIGELAVWFNSFMESMRSMIQDIIRYAETLDTSSGGLSDLSGQMSDSASLVSSKTGLASRAADDMNTKMNSVASSMEEAAVTMETIASSAEEMTATINEVAESAEKARSITKNAVSEVQNASGKVDALGNAAEEIGMVTETITEISEQTNLLALNATIEAARAGEAGKGFAVVADEIKNLARQTAEATNQIKQKIGGIQDSTSDTVGGIDRILGVIKEVNNTVSTIATAVEQQSSTTREIAVNVSQASEGIQDVNADIAQSASTAGDISSEVAGATQSANEMATSSVTVSTNAEELKRLASKLNQLVGRFKV